MRELIFIFPDGGRQSKDRILEDIMIPYVNWSTRYGFDFPLGRLKYFDGIGEFQEVSLDTSSLESEARKVYEEKIQEKPERCFYLMEYSNILTDISERWRKNFEELSKSLAVLGVSADRVSRLSRIGDYIGNYPGDGFKKFFWTNLAVPLLYKLIPEVRGLIVSKVLRAVVSEVSKSHQKYWKGINICFIGHGLGTAVAADVVEEYYRIIHSRSKDKNMFPVVNSLIQISNISHLLAGDTLDLSENNIKYKESPSRGGRGCEIYYTCGHRGDIFTLDGMEFTPEAWDRSSYMDESNRSIHLTKEVLDGGRDLEDMKLPDIAERIHSFEHYVSNPRILFEVIKRMDTYRYWGNVRETIEEAVKVYNKSYSLWDEGRIEKVLEAIAGEGVGDALKKILNE